MILCCGEALIDMIPETTVAGSEVFAPHSGGAIYNTAIALGRLGVSAGILTGLSSDMFGQRLLQGLRSANLDTSHIVISERPSTLAFVHLSNGQADYTFYDENSAGRMLSFADIPKLSEHVTALYFGGISLACEPGATAYSELLAKEGGRYTVMIDPNIRPGFIEDEARYRVRLNEMIASADIVKVSEEDAHWIFQDSMLHERMAEAILSRGPVMVIMTQGATGATAFLRSGPRVSIEAEEVKVIDTVGAGDTFNAGVMAKLSELGLMKKERLPEISLDAAKEALTFGARVAAITVSRAGANPPWIDEL